MYNILIVDDERFIADGLSVIIQDEFQDGANVFKAYSGMQAIEMCKKTTFDILLTDVCMPEMDGFELSKQVRELFSECRVVFLSAYSNFNYAQLAIRRNGVDYVVKAEGDDAIIASLKKAIDDIEKKSRNSLLIEKSQKNMQKAMPLLRNEYIIRLLDGQECQPSLLDGDFRELGICLDYNMPVLILICRIEFNDTESQKRMHNICGIQSIVQECLKKVSTSMDVEYGYDVLVWIIQPKKGNDENFTKVADCIEKALDDFRNSFLELFGAGVSFAFSPKAVAWSHLSETFYTLKLAFNKKRGFNQSAIFIQNDDETEVMVSEKFSQHQIYVVRTQMKQLENLGILLETRQEEKFNEQFESIMKNISLCRKLSYYLLVEFYYEVALMFLSYINRFGLKEKISKKIDTDMLMNMEDHPSWEGTVEYFRKLAKAIFESEIEDSTESNRIVTDIEDYIERNLDSDVSLSSIADELHFNPSYLSRIFKQCTNKSITEYIAEMRINKLCRLLADRKLKIYEIAAMCGFESIPYFYRFFKKYMTITPQEYRDRVTGREGG